MEAPAPRPRSGIFGLPARGPWPEFAAADGSGGGSLVHAAPPLSCPRRCIQAAMLWFGRILWSSSSCTDWPFMLSAAHIRCDPGPLPDGAPDTGTALQGRKSIFRRPGCLTGGLSPFCCRMVSSGRRRPRTILPAFGYSEQSGRFRQLRSEVPMTVDGQGPYRPWPTHWLLAEAAP